jgi:Zn2+/Cd2+-exporting ATPase
MFPSNEPNRSSAFHQCRCVGGSQDAPRGHLLPKTELQSPTLRLCWAAMKKAPSSPPDAAPDNSRCLVQAVAEAFDEEPSLEAVKINRAQQSISVATLGQVDNAAIERAITERIQRLQQAEAAACKLLDGSPDCSGCAVAPLPEVTGRLTIQHDANTTTIARVTCPTAPKFWRWRDLPWPRIIPREVVLPDDDHHEDEWKLQLVAAILCGAFGLSAWLSGEATFALPLYFLAYLSGAWFTVVEIWELLQKRSLDVHFLMLAVAAGSASIGAWGEGAMLLFLFSLSGALEHYAMGRTSREIRSLFKATPKEASVLDAQGHERLEPIEKLEPGMRLLIKPGQQFPVDAEVAKGATASDESNLTGEATPVEKNIGDTVLAGTMNLWGAVETTVLRRANQSALQKIIHLIREAQHLKAPSQRFTDKFGTGYTYGVLGLTALMFFVWWLGFGQEPFVSTATTKSAFYKAMTLLVVASPCALVLSIPSAVLAAIAWGAKRGILFRGGAAVENLAKVSVVAMDKTGTLTTGELRVERIESFPAGRESEIARLAYSLERLSTHPLARAITRYGKQQELTPVDVGHVESITGAGLQAKLGNDVVRLGKRAWLADGAQAAVVNSVPQTEAGFSEVWLTADGLAGRILLRDDIRPQARAVVEKLRELGLRSVVLTGDRKATGDHLKQQLAVDEVRSELKPEEKVAAIRSFITGGHQVAMIGDGVNDAPSLAVADVGVAMGARGSDAALEQAEVVLMHDRLENFLTAFQLSRRASRIIRQNLIISLGTVAVLMACALFGKIPLTLGVIGHEGSTVIVVMNSLRLLFSRS